MPYTPTVWADSPATTSPLDAANLNNMSSQYSEAVNSFEQDLFTPFVYGSGSFVATKDGTNASQLDVTAGVAFLLQTDGTLRRRAPTSSTQSTTGHPSTTMFLDLNPDGSWSWGTAHSGVSGHLTIASVTTDSSAHIVTVTDARTLSTTLLSGMAGRLIFGGALQALSFSPGPIDTTSGNQAWLVTAADAHSGKGWSFYTFQDGSLNLYEWTGGHLGLSISPSGNVNSGGTLTQNGSNVVLQGSGSAGQPAIAYGPGVPSTLSANEIYFQTS